MHIAHFTNAYLPVVSGVARAVSTLRKTLTELGHNVFVFAQEDDYQDEQPFIFRYRSFPLPQPVDFPAAIPVSPFNDRLILALKLDVIHSHHPIFFGSGHGQQSAGTQPAPGIHFPFSIPGIYPQFSYISGVAAKLFKGDHQQSAV